MEGSGGDYGPKTGKACKRSLLIQTHFLIANHVETIWKTSTQTSNPYTIKQSAHGNNKTELFRHFYETNAKSDFELRHVSFCGN